MSPEIDITTGRIDDFPLLLEGMIQLGFPGLIDHPLNRHGLQQGLSWEWITAIWLAHILTESNHRKLLVQARVRQAGKTIERITGQIEQRTLNYGLVDH
jgi:transposase